MIYQKSGSSCPATTKRYFQEFEYMFIFSKTSPLIFNGLRMSRTTSGNRIMTKRRQDGTMFKRMCIMDYTRLSGNVWDIDCGYMRSNKDKAAYDHPAIFPDKLVHDHVVSWSNPGCIVLDPMCGSGTTCKIAKRLNRHFIGIDISSKYCEIAEERLAQGVL